MADFEEKIDPYFIKKANHEIIRLCKNSSVAKTRHCKNSSEKNLKVLYKI